MKAAHAYNEMAGRIDAAMVAGAGAAERRTPAAAVGPTVRLLRGDAVELKAVRWQWRGFLPAGMLTVLGGSPGCGKTTIAESFAAIVTTAGIWPDGSRCAEAGDVLVWSGEDAHEVTASRLKACGADMKRVHLIDGISGSDGDAFDPGRDMPLLEAAAKELANPRLLIIDPIVSAVAGDGHKSNEVRRALQPVVDLAHRLGCAVLGITHFTKGTAGRDPVERITGSLAFAALARVVLVAAKVKTDDAEAASPGACWSGRSRTSARMMAALPIHWNASRLRPALKASLSHGARHCRERRARCLPTQKPSRKKARNRRRSMMRWPFSRQN